jgi:hypothetical protein
MENGVGIVCAQRVNPHADLNTCLPGSSGLNPHPPTCFIFQYLTSCVNKTNLY